MSLRKQASLLVVTRVHMQTSSNVPNVDKMIDFIIHSSSYANKILICVGTNYLPMKNYLLELQERVKLLTSIPVDLVDFLSIDPWGYFTHSLNAAVIYAQDNAFERVAFQSVEFRIDNQQVNELLLFSRNNNALVIGPKMSGHEFTSLTDNLESITNNDTTNSTSIEHHKSLITVRGRTVPWNTFAIWNVNALGTTGFPLIGDGVAGRREIGGVEEVSAINLLQLIDNRRKAVLVRFAPKPADSSSQPDDNDTVTLTTTISSGSEWHTQFTGDPARQSYHDEKMRSKDERPARQEKLSGIPPGVVEHVTLYI